MSHEFELHHLVSELVSLLRVTDTVDVDTQVDLLLNNRTPYITTQVSAHAAKRKIAEFSLNGEQFLHKYDDLKVRQTRNLDPLVYLLSKVTEDRRLCGFLQAVRPGAEEAGLHEVSDVKVLDLVEGQEVELPEKGAVLTQEEIDQLMSKLENVTATLQEREKARQKESKESGKFPKLPSWLSERGLLSRDFCELPKGVASLSGGGVSLGSMPLALQQKAIVEDILFLMNGVDGRYIHANPLSQPNDQRSFDVDRSMDPALLSLVHRLLPLSSHYSTVTRFSETMSRFVHGMVNQALAASMRALLKEYLLVSAQLETQHRLGQLTLQKLWYYVQPCLHALEILARVAISITKGACRGGKTLSALHHLASGYTGDGRSQDLCVHVAKAACEPYFDMLASWVLCGEVRDPYGEFMVVEHESIAKDRLHVEYNDAYWENRYTVSQENIPSFLEHVAEKVLRTGKYLNVVGECGKEVDYPGSRQLSYSPHERGYVDTIEQAYTFASKSLLEMMMEGEDLMGYLRSLKHYFLMDQGDLMVHFLDMAQDELFKPMADILPQRLESLLELALRTSLADHDPYKDNVKPILVPYDLVTQLFYIMAIQPEGVGPDAVPPPPIARPDPNSVGLSGVEAFSLDYQVKWPLSLVISRKSLFKYQMLFRHLFFCRHVERQLCATWTHCKGAKAVALKKLSWYPSAFALLQRMLNFVQNLQYYMSFEVLEPNWRQLEKGLHSVSNIDDVLLMHNDFLDKCLRDCMLSSREVLKTMSRLLSICITFTKHISFARLQREGSEFVDRPGDGGSEVKELVQGCDEQFTRDLVQLLEWLYTMSSESVGSMVARLDFNGFYRTCYTPTTTTTTTATTTTHNSNVL